MELTFASKGDLYCVKDYSFISSADSDADANAKISMPQFPNGRFHGLFSVSYGKKGVCCRDENIAWFSILL